MINQARGQGFLDELPELNKELPYPPHLLRDLFSMTGDSSLASLDQISLAISKDQGLTTRVLAMANSAFYGLQAKVNSVGRAISLLGLMEVRNLIVVLCVQNLTQNHKPPAGFSLRDYWNHQLSAAVCCRHLAREHKLADPDVLFTAGLLHDLGKLITAIYRPEDWLAIEVATQDEQQPYYQAEEDYWGLEHGVIGAMVLDSWNLPPDLTEPVNWHHAPDLAPENKDEARLVCVADGLHHALCGGGSPVPPNWTEAAEKLGLDPEALADEINPVLQDASLMQFAAVIG